MKICINPAYQPYKDFIARIPLLFNEEGTVLHQGRNTVKSFCTDSGEWIVKRYKKFNIAQQIAYTFWRKSKAEKAYLYAARLRELDIDTPEGIAYIEKREHGLLAECYFISTACHDPSINIKLEGEPGLDKGFCTELARFFIELHDKGFLHGDLNQGNILFRPNADGSMHFTVIDTNRSVFKPHPTPFDCLDNLKRLTYQRELLQYIAEEYARLRHWDIRQSVNTATACQEHFVTRREKKKKMNHIMLRK